ncbi:MAG: PTS transporter subunit EIIC [Erysipelotrichaceae bacterium]|nr:PTS transporter subunit EIIC [Erysipelotrichaceae bacterium]
MAKYADLCSQILENVGGKENVSSALHCMTRLRINFKDKEKINVDAIKGIKGVLGAQFSGEQFQVIIGQHVSEVYPEFCQMAGIAQGAAIDENLDKKEPFDIKKVPSKVLEYVSGSITPMLPIMIGVGWFKLFYSLLGPNLLNVASETSDFMRLLYIVGQAGFYFMPVFLAYGAALKLKTNVVLSVFLGLMLVDPNIIQIATDGIPFKIYGLIPMPLNNYTQSLIPILLSVWAMKYVYDFMNKIMPNWFKIIGIPLGTIGIMLPLMFCVLAPIGNWIGVALSAFFSTLYSVAGPLAVALIGGFWMYLVATGMHGAIIQIALLNITTLGYDPVVLAGAQAANCALMGMAIAYFIRTKGEEKQLAATNAVTLVLGGISEPTIFSVLIRNKRAMISYTVGGLIAGLIVGISGAAIYILGGSSNILCFLTYAGGPSSSFIWGTIACATGFVISLVVGLIIGFGDKADGLQNYKPKTKKANA